MPTILRGGTSRLVQDSANELLDMLAKRSTFNGAPKTPERTVKPKESIFASAVATRTTRNSNFTSDVLTRSNNKIVNKSSEFAHVSQNSSSAAQSSITFGRPDSINSITQSAPS